MRAYTNMRQDTIATHTIVVSTCSRPLHFLFVSELIEQILEWIAPAHQPTHDFFSFIYAIKSLSTKGWKIFNEHTKIPFFETKEENRVLLEAWYSRFILDRLISCFYISSPFFYRLTARLEHLEQCRFILNQKEKVIGVEASMEHFFDATTGKKTRHGVVWPTLRDSMGDCARHIAVKTEESVALKTLVMGVKHYYHFALAGLLYAACITGCILLAMEASRQGCFVIASNTASADGGSCRAPLHYGNKIFSCLDENVGNYLATHNHTDILQVVRHVCAPFYPCNDVTNMSNNLFVIKLCNSGFESGKIMMIIATCVLHLCASFICSIVSVRSAQGYENTGLRDREEGVCFLGCMLVFFGPLVCLPAALALIPNLLANVAYLAFCCAITAVETCIDHLFPKKIPGAINANSFFTDFIKKKQDAREPSNLFFTRTGLGTEL